MLQVSCAFKQASAFVTLAVAISCAFKQASAFVTLAVATQKDAHRLYIVDS